MADNTNASPSQGIPTDPELKAVDPGGSRGAPGHDGVVGDAETDPDRRDLRSEIGKYVSLASFPATAQDLMSIAMANGAPEGVIRPLRSLDSGAVFETTRDLWYALHLETKERF